MKWIVTVAHPQTLLGEIEVEADNQDDAWEIAEKELDKYEKGEESAISWDDEGNSDGCAYVEEIITEEEYIENNLDLVEDQ